MDKLILRIKTYLFVKWIKFYTRTFRNSCGWGGVGVGVVVNHHGGGEGQPKTIAAKNNEPPKNSKDIFDPNNFQPKKMNPKISNENI